MQHVFGAVVTRGGAVLWSSSPISDLKAPNPVDSLIRETLLESRASNLGVGSSGSGAVSTTSTTTSVTDGDADGIVNFGPHDVAHALVNDHSLVCVVSTPRVLGLRFGPRVARALRTCVTRAIATHGPESGIASLSSGKATVGFEGAAFVAEAVNAAWKGVVDKVAADGGGQGASDAAAGAAAPRSRGKGGGGGGEKKSDEAASDRAQNDDGRGGGDGDGAGSSSEGQLSDPEDEEDEEARRLRKLAEARAKLRRKAAAAASSSTPPSSPSTPKDSPAGGKGKKGKGKKERRAWDGSAAKPGDADALDFSSDKGTADDFAGSGPASHDPTRAAKVDLDDFGPDDLLDGDADGGADGGSGGMFSYFRKLVGNHDLTREDLTAPMEAFKEQLMDKNVGSEIADKICESVLQSMIGKRLGTFGSVTQVIREAMERALTTILTPKRSIDILREIEDARRERRLYTIVFVGVNGVGKSTSLSKTCFYLLQNHLKVMIAACDTFRAGAVEQLGEHCRRLGVPLFQKGYGKDAAAVARAGVDHAAAEGMDVLLIDTAGRMQGNEPLMKSLAKLVSVNRPDLILFVGEALVGNDGVDQVVEFNRAMNEYSTDKEPRLIDGIFLTKFDTIDEKVGAALSMVYSTGQPVIFVGVGQQYPDLRRMNVKAVVRSLLK